LFIQFSLNLTHKKIQREVETENLDLSSNEMPLCVYNFLPNPRISFKSTQSLTIKCHKSPLLRPLKITQQNNCIHRLQWTNTEASVPHMSIASPCFQRLLQYKIVLLVPWSGAPYSFLRQWWTTLKHWSWTTWHPTLTTLRIWHYQTNFLISPSEILKRTQQFSTLPSNPW